MSNRGLRVRLDYELVLVVLFSIFALQSLFRSGFPPGYDMALHFYRVVQLVHCWRDGVLYPRWAPDMAFGLGYPLFNFYAPLLYYVVGLLHLAGLSVEVALKAVIGASLVGGGIGMYLLAKEWLGRSAGLLAAVAFAYAPFRLREISLEGNYPQLLGLALTPLVLWSLHRLLILGRRPYLLTTALGYGMLLLTHNASAFLATPLIIAYALFFLWAFPEARRRAVPAALAFGLGLGLAAFFWAPALLEAHLVQFDVLRKGSFFFRFHFLSLQHFFLPSAPLDRNMMFAGFRFTLGLAHVLLTLPSLLLLRKVELRSILVFAWLVLLVAVFLMLRYSSFLWEWMPLLAFLQFPWRLLGLAALVLAFLVGASFLAVPTKLSTAFLLVASLGLILSIFPVLYPDEPFVKYGGRSVAEIISHELQTGAVGTTASGEFLPLGVDMKSLRNSPLVALYLNGEPIDKLDRSSLPEGVMAETLEHQADRDRFRFTSSEPFTARLHTLYYLGWRAYLDHRPVAIEPLEGRISVKIPEGEHELLVRFESTPLRRVAAAISWASLLGIGVTMLIWQPKPSERQAWQVVQSSPITGKTTLVLGAVVVTAFAFKALYVDPHTFWFRRASPVEQPPGCEQLTDATFGGRIDLIGYSLDKGVPLLGDQVKITLFWQALEPIEEDWSVFMHLKSADSEEILAQADVPHPGGIPTSVWQLGKFVEDEHILEIPSEAAPGIYRVTVGLYLLSTWERLPLTKEANEYILLPRLRVVRGTPERRSDIYTLGEDIELVDYKLGPEPVRPGQLLTVTLYWQAKKKLGQDWTVFLHFVGPDGHRWGQQDGYPVGKQYPTSIWLPGEVVEDERYIVVPAGVPPGQYRLLVGMYDLATMERLAARGPEGPLAEDAIVLPVKVEPTGE